VPSDAYILERPTTRDTSVVFASPHSGNDYPWSFLRTTLLDEVTIRSSEDAFVDQLYAQAPKYGAPLLCAGAPRAFIDLNRDHDELDPALIHGTRRNTHNPRVASGLGVIPRVVAGSRAIYRGKMPFQDAIDRIDQYWHPYHDKLTQVLDESHAAFGEAILLDCHSMPHEAIANIAQTGGKRPDVVIGDRFGASASRNIVEQVEAAFASAGLTVVRNAPFAGAYVAKAYGRPAQNQHAIQIEIDRSIYMDEARIEPNANFTAFKHILTGIIAELSNIGRSSIRVAAE
jgi:N-formylglutamate amidohydrolase